MLLNIQKIFCTTIILNQNLDRGKILLTKRYKIPRNKILIENKLDNLVRAKNIVLVIKNLEKYLNKKKILENGKSCIFEKNKPLDKNFEKYKDKINLQVDKKKNGIIENSKTTYLQCESLKGNKIALIEINKIDGEKQKLEELGIKEFQSSPAYWDIVENVETSCYSDPAFLEIVGENTFCSGLYDEGGESR